MVIFLTIHDIINSDDLFRNKNTSYESVPGGNVNKAYKVLCEEKAYFVRINGSQSSFLGLDSRLEAEACQQAAKMSVAPFVYNMKNAESYLITDYFTGKCLSAEQARNPEIMKKTIFAIKKIHEHVKVERHFSIYDLIDRYLSAINKSTVKLPCDFSKILIRYEKIKQKRNDDNTAKVFCHNDIWQNNILFDGEKICIIDWELCGYSDIFSDLAQIPCLLNTTFEEEKWLLTCYFGFFEMEMWNILQDLKYIRMMENVTWSFYHAGISDEMHNPDFDYMKFGNKVTDILLSGINHF